MTSMVGSARLAGELARLRRSSCNDLQALFGPWFQRLGPTGTFRRRLFDPLTTFWIFLSQTLDKGRSCREALRQWLGLLAAQTGLRASPNTAAYCKARARLPMAMIEQAHDEVIRNCESKKTPGDLWNGREVKVVDGSSFSMPDTPVNQHAYPQPSQQTAGCGFPVMRIVVLFSLATGAALAVAGGSLKLDERSLFRRLWRWLAAGAVVLADRGFCSYADLYLLGKRGVDCVMRKNQARTKGVRKLRSLGKRDRLVEWTKTAARPKWLARSAWLKIPPTMTLREITFAVPMPGFRTKVITVVTTLLDPRLYPTQAFIDLYRRRWMAELFLRDIKTTMGAEVLRAKSPEMAQKELRMFLIAYNLIRCLMLEAARAHDLCQYRLSFKGAVSTVRQWAPIMAYHPFTGQQRRAMRQHLLYYIAADQLPDRPGRAEPRALKRRPKPFSLLTKPREQYRELPHRNHYKKGRSGA
jgi:hypothetical protein